MITYNLINRGFCIQGPPKSLPKSSEATNVTPIHMKNQQTETQVRLRYLNYLFAYLLNSKSR
jgi:hypothetical protein